jgi:hypothetical protein
MENNTPEQKIEGYEETAKSCETHCSDCPYEDWYACHGMTQTHEPMDNTEDKKPLTLQEQAENRAIIFYPDTHTEKYTSDGPHKILSSKWQRNMEEIELFRRCFVSGFKDASQQNEALQAKTEADKIYIDTLHGQIGDLKSEKEALQAEIEHYKKLWKQDNEALKSEVERLKEEIKYKVFDYKHAKGQLEKISADYESEAKTDKARITQLEEALRECIMYCHDDTAIERFKKALSQNNQLEKI